AVAAVSRDPSRDAAEDAGPILELDEDHVLLAGYLQPHLLQRASRLIRVVDADMGDGLAVLDVRTRAFDVDVRASDRLAERCERARLVGQCDGEIFHGAVLCLAAPPVKVRGHTS